MNKLRFLIGTLLTIILLSACQTSYLRVEVALDKSPNILPSTKEITESKSFKDIKEKIKNVMILLPETITSQSKLVVNNSDSKDAKILISEDIAIWVSEIEKQFIRNGFNVISRQKAEETQRQKGFTRLEETAGDLGIDAFIQINNLEFNWEYPYQFITTKKVFFKSDNKGANLGQTSIFEKTKTKIDIFIDGDLTKTEFKAVPAIFGNLDCKVIYAKTGEVVWLYRNKSIKYPNIEKKNWFYIFYVSLEGEIYYFNPDAPQKSFSLFQTPQKYSESTNTQVQGKENQKQIEMQLKIDIIKMVFEEFFSNFK